MGGVRRVGGLVAVAVAVALGGCDVGPIRRPPPVAPEPVPAPTTGATGPFDERRPVLPVPAGLSPHTIEFADRDHGYALASECVLDSTVSAGPGTTQIRCTAALAVTGDGGLTWVRRNHPQPVARNQQMYVLDAVTVVLWPEGHGWYVSTDSGRTFTHQDGAALPAYGTFSLFCDPAPCGVVEFTASGPRRLPVQPALPGTLTVLENPNGYLWAASVADGRAYSAISRDRGGSWQRHEVPTPDGDGLVRVDLRISADGADVWLLGYRTDTRDEFPARIWFFEFIEPSGWVPRGASGHPPEVRALAAAGGRVLVALGPTGMGTVGETYSRRPDWPANGDFVTVLQDGTLLVRSQNRLLFGEGHGERRRWTAVVVTTP